MWCTCPPSKTTSKEVKIHPDASFQEAMRHTQRHPNDRKVPLNGAATHLLPLIGLHSHGQGIARDACIVDHDLPETERPQQGRFDIESSPEASTPSLRHHRQHGRARVPRTRRKHRGSVPIPEGKQHSTRLKDPFGVAKEGFA